MPHNNNNNKYDFVLNSLFLLLEICFDFDTCMFSIYELFAIIIINITHYFCTTHTQRKQQQTTTLTLNLTKIATKNLN